MKRSGHARWLLVLALALACTSAPESPGSPESPEPELVSFPSTDGGVVYGDVYGAGEHAVVLVHGGRFDRTSWAEQARVLEKEGFLVLSIDLRGYGQSRGGTETDDPYAGLEHDVLGAVRYLHGSGAQRVSVVGGSMGGGAAADAAVIAKPDEIDKLVLLAHSSVDEPERMRRAGGYADLYLSYEVGQPEVALDITRAPAADLGVPAFQIGRTISRERGVEAGGIIRRLALAVGGGDDQHVLHSGQVRRRDRVERGDGGIEASASSMFTQSLRQRLRRAGL